MYFSNFFVIGHGFSRPLTPGQTVCVCWPSQVSFEYAEGLAKKYAGREGFALKAQVNALGVPLGDGEGRAYTAVAK